MAIQVVIVTIPMAILTIRLLGTAIRVLTLTPHSMCMVRQVLTDGRCGDCDRQHKDCGSNGAGCDSTVDD